MEQDSGPLLQEKESRNLLQLISLIILKNACVML